MELRDDRLAIDRARDLGAGHLPRAHFGDLGREWCEAAETNTERSILIRHLMEGQYGSSVRAIAFNTAAGWSRDVTEEVARELWNRCAAQGEVPGSLQAFLEHHGR